MSSRTLGLISLAEKDTLRAICPGVALANLIDYEDEHRPGAPCLCWCGVVLPPETHFALLTLIEELAFLLPNLPPKIGQIAVEQIEQEIDEALLGATSKQLDLCFETASQQSSS